VVASRIKGLFVGLADPRVDRTKRHQLGDIIVMAILAVLSGCDGWDDIVDFAAVRESWLKTFLELPNGVPCADTFRRVFGALDPRQFGRCFSQFVAELGGHVEGKLVCIDGKTMRRTFARERGQGPLHIVSAWVAENAVLLGQVAVEEKSNEVVAIPELLAMLELKGATAHHRCGGLSAQDRGGDRGQGRRLRAVAQGQPAAVAPGGGELLRGCAE
jgi:hypothetical protein